MGGMLCYQHPKGDKEHKGATLKLPSGETSWLALSLVCYLTQHSCKQTRLEMNDRFSFKIEHETKAFFFVTVGEWKCLLEKSNFNRPIPFHSSLNYLFKTQNTEPRKAFRNIAVSTCYGWNSWDLCRRKDLPPNHTAHPWKSQNLELVFEGLLSPGSYCVLWYGEQGKVNGSESEYLGSNCIKWQTVWLRASHFSLLHLPIH